MDLLSRLNRLERHSVQDGVCLLVTTDKMVAVYVDGEEHHFRTEIQARDFIKNRTVIVIDV